MLPSIKIWPLIAPFKIYMDRSCGEMLSKMVKLLSAGQNLRVGDHDQVLANWLAHPVRLAPHPCHLLDRHVEEGGQLLVVIDRHLSVVISGVVICR